jgi:hypothetical protein
MTAAGGGVAKYRNASINNEAKIIIGGIGEIEINISTAAAMKHLNESGNE